MKKQKAALSLTLKQEFKKDLELFQYFLVLLNSSSPIRNVELMWAEDLELFDPSQQPRINTGDALVQLQHMPTEAQGRCSPSPSTHFCDLVHGFGTYEEQTCAKSDKPAKELCRATRRSQMYPCHVGLTDIAVPVICEDRYLGTLFSGQVMTEMPTAKSFARVKEALKDQPHIDLKRLEEAYFQVPVVTTAQLAEMVRMLEIFARYLANSWKRLKIMSEFQQMQERELSLDRRELVEKLLSRQMAGGGPDEMEALRTLARNVGLERLPDRVLVLRMQLGPEDAAYTCPASDAAEQTSADRIAKQLTLARVAHSIEDRCRSWPNTLASVIAPGEIGIFTSQKSQTPDREHHLTEEIGQALLRAARAQGVLTARIGVSALHPQPLELLRAYHEAVAALDSGRSTLSWFESLPVQQRQPMQALGRVLNALKANDPAVINSSLREFLASVPAGSSIAQLQQARGLLTWACEHLALELGSMTLNSGEVSDARENAIQLIIGANSSLAMTDAFRSFVEQMRQYVTQLFSQREQKIVSETHRLVRELGPGNVSIQDIARNLKLSAGHLGRVYSRTTGQTLEEYLIRMKLELGKQLLLDPRLQVSEVSDRCGFCNPAYFASVFKKYMNCTPRAYANQPHRQEDKNIRIAS